MPFSRGQVLIIVLGCALVVFASAGFFKLTVERRLRSWAQSQGYELVSWEFPPFVGMGLLNVECLFTVRDHTGNHISGRANFLGFTFRPVGVDVQLLPHQERHDVPRLWRIIVIVLGAAAAVALYLQLFGLW